MAPKKLYVMAVVLKGCPACEMAKPVIKKCMKKNPDIYIFEYSDDKQKEKATKILGTHPPYFPFVLGSSSARFKDDMKNGTATKAPMKIFQGNASDEESLLEWMGA